MSDYERDYERMSLAMNATDDQAAELVRVAESMAPSLTDFLLARIAEDEADAKAALDWSSRWFTAHDGVLDRVGFVGDGPDVHIVRWSPTRVLAECEAKRRIVEAARHTLFDDPLRRTDFWRGARDVVEGDLCFLALPYADHPDYREEWKP